MSAMLQSGKKTLLLAICLLIGARIATSKTTDGKSVPNTYAICFEAEHANEVTPIVHITRKEGASGGIAITVPEGAAARCPTQDTGHALYHLHIPADGLYYTWFRVWWQGTCSNSIFCSLLPALPRFAVMGNVFGKWHWIHGPMARLNAGPAELEIAYREDGIWVDQVLLTTQADAGPTGPLKTNTIPMPPPERSEMTVSLSADALACDSLAAPRLRVATHSDHPASVSLDQLVVLIPGRDTKLTAWLRNNSLEPGSGTLSLLTRSRIGVDPGPSQSYAFAKDQPLGAWDFTLRPPPDLERRSHKAIIRAVLPSGKVEALRLNLYCPFRWICSEAYPFSPMRGIDTANPIEQAASPLDVGMWHLAPDESTTPMGLVDMRKAVCEKDFVMAYAYTEVRPPAPGKYLLYTANDDMMKVWVNGQMVHCDDSEQPTAATCALTPIDLAEGRNPILVKMCQKRNFWEFLLEIRNLDGGVSDVEGCDAAQLLRNGARR